jgi:hypothetical protein
MNYGEDIVNITFKFLYFLAARGVPKISISSKNIVVNK